MTGIPFKPNSQNYNLNEYFKRGGSLTNEEAREQLDIRQLSQRVADISKIYKERTEHSPLMYIWEQTDSRHKYKRYFFKGAGCKLEHNPTAMGY